MGDLSKLPAINRRIVPVASAAYGQDRTQRAWIGKDCNVDKIPIKQFSGSEISHHLMTELGMWSDFHSIYRRLHNLGEKGTFVYLSKHTRPEGLAMHKDPAQAVKNAYRELPAAFGAEAFILPKVTEAVAAELVKINPDVIMSPEYDTKAKEIISNARAKTKKLRGLVVTEPLWQPSKYRPTEAIGGGFACEERQPFFMPEDLQFNRENYSPQKVRKIEAQAILALAVSAMNYSNGTGYTNRLENTTIGSDGGVGMREEGFHFGLIKALESTARLQLTGKYQGTIATAVSTDGFIFNKDTIDEVLSPSAINNRKRSLAEAPVVLYQKEPGKRTTRAERRKVYKEIDLEIGLLVEPGRPPEQLEKSPRARRVDKGIQKACDKYEIIRVTSKGGRRWFRHQDEPMYRELEELLVNWITN